MTATDLSPRQMLTWPVNKQFHVLRVLNRLLTFHDIALCQIHFLCDNIFRSNRKSVTDPIKIHFSL